MIPFVTCTLSDGTTTLNLLDNIHYGLDSFDFVVAALQQSELAAGGPYQVVEQSISVNVFGDTPIACWDNATRLITLLRQSAMWARDIPVSYVRLAVQTDYSATLVGCDVLGSTGPDDPLMGLEPQIIEPIFGYRYVLQGVQLTFKRSGAWEAAVENSVTSNTITNPAVMLATFGSSNSNYSRIRVGGQGPSNTPNFLRFGNYGMVLLANDDDKIKVVDSASFNTPSKVTNVVDTTNDALGGSVRRFEASTTELTPFALIPSTASGWLTAKRRIGVYIAARNNSASVTFYARANVANVNNTPLYTGYTEIDTSSTQPRLFYLGLVTSRFDLAPSYSIYINVSASTTSAAHTLDIDYVVLHCLDDPWTDRTLVYNNAYSASGANAFLTLEPGSSIQRTPYPLSLLTTAGGNSDSVNPRGDSYVVASGNEQAICVLSTNGDAKWRLQDSSPTTAQQLFTIRRSLAYLIPPGGIAP